MKKKEEREHVHIHSVDTGGGLGLVRPSSASICSFFLFLKTSAVNKKSNQKEKRNWSAYISHGDYPKIKQGKNKSKHDGSKRGV